MAAVLCQSGGPSTTARMAMTRLKLLVTGFGPFPGVRVNPTARLAAAVAASPRFGRAGFGVEAVVVETSYRRGLPRLRQALEAIRPDAVLMLGVAARARFIRIERFARAGASILHPDAGGEPGAHAAAAHPVLKASFPPDAALPQLLRTGLPARLSPSAGRYLCNAGYRIGLEHAAVTGAPALFVHVPWPRPAAGARPAGRSRWRPDAGRLAGALAAVGLDMLKAARIHKTPRILNVPARNRADRHGT
jgi:pyroglutamyl-peptidase